MASTVLSEAILTVAVIAAATILTAALIPNFQLILNSQTLKTLKLKEEAEIEVDIIFANAIPSENTVKVWVKNVGYKSIHKSLIGSTSDIFFGKRGDAMLRIPYNASSPPTWTYTIPNDEDMDENWDPQETLEVTITLPANTLNAGDWIVRFTVYTGAYSDFTFSL